MSKRINLVLTDKEYQIVLDSGNGPTQIFKEALKKEKSQIRRINLINEKLNKINRTICKISDCVLPDKA